MSSATGVPAQFDTTPVSGSVRRGSSIHRRAQSSPGSSSGGMGPGAPFMFRSTSSRRARAEGSAPPFSYAGSSVGTRESTTASVRVARAIGEEAEDLAGLYENFFIGSTKRPLEQNRILPPAEVSKVEKEEGEKERKDELADAIKQALGLKKKAHKYKDNLPTRQYSGVLASRANSVMPKAFFTTDEVNAYRHRKN